LWPRPARPEVRGHPSFRYFVLAGSAFREGCFPWQNRISSWLRQPKQLRTTRRSNAALLSREHLTPDEVEVLVEAAKGNRHGLRDATMILVAFRHGLRAAEVCDLRWNQVRCNPACKAGQARHAQHPPLARRRDARIAPAAAGERSVAVRLRQRAGLPVHYGRLRANGRAGGSGRPPGQGSSPHRQACGYALADRGYDTRAIQVWLGHRFRRSRCVNRYQPAPATPAAGRSSPPSPDSLVPAASTASRRAVLMGLPPSWQPHCAGSLRAPSPIGATPSC
jgi:integrase